MRIPILHLGQWDVSSAADESTRAYEITHVTTTFRVPSFASVSCDRPSLGYVMCALEFAPLPFRPAIWRTEGNARSDECCAL